MLTAPPQEPEVTFKDLGPEFLSENKTTLQSRIAEISGNVWESFGAG